MIFLIFISCTFSYSQASVWDNLTANIAVIEYRPVLDKKFPEDLFIENIFAFSDVLNEITNDTNLDMIIFPESSLQSNTSSAVEVVINTVWNDTDFNYGNYLSGIAAAYKTNLVVNVVEKSKCKDSEQSKNCKDFGFHFYNTDVVLDRTGKIINKYRKYNLFGEKPLEKPEKADQIIIRTDFGVNFGIFTGFDILMKSPAQDLLNQNVDGVIFPNLWFSELPFLTALQTQQMWSQTHDITLLAAGISNPLEGSGGSGFFRGSRGAVLSDIVTENVVQFRIHKNIIYKSKNGEISPQEPQDVDVLAKDMDDFFLKTDKSVEDYKNLVLNASAMDFETQLCYENGTEIQFCCNFTLKMSKKDVKSNKNIYIYHLVAYSGVRSFDNLYYGGIQVCGILACLNSSLTSCGQRFPKYEEVDWPVTFEEITIKANFEKSEDKTQFPNSLLSSIRPIEATKTTWTSEDKEEGGESLVLRTFSIIEKQDRLLTFAIYGRNFEQDFAPPDNSDDDDNNNDDDDGGNDNDNGNGKGAGNPIWEASRLLLCCSVFLTKFLFK